MLHRHCVSCDYANYSVTVCRKHQRKHAKAVQRPLDSAAKSIRRSVQKQQRQQQRAEATRLRTSKHLSSVEEGGTRQACIARS